MNRKYLIALPLIAALGILVSLGSFVVAQSARDGEAAGQPEMQLPPGWTEEDMQACMAAATPGEMHKFLAEGAGKWQAKTTMWMYPGAEPMASEGTSTVTPIMDGRYVQVEMKGEMPGMGPYHGSGIYGFDNVAEQFVSTWIDNHSTGIMYGKGELSDDGKTLTWKYTYHCPVTGKPTVMREVETITGEHTKTLDMFGVEPKSGKEFKMMHIELTRKP